MSWLQKLYETYEYCSRSGSTELGAVPAPVGQMIQFVQAEMMIDQLGNVLHVRALPRTSNEGTRSPQETLIPCTEDSQNRTRAACAHPLFDKLEYMAGDFFDYAWIKEKQLRSDAPPKNEDGENNQKRVQEIKAAHEAYLQGLDELCKFSIERNGADCAVTKQLTAIRDYLQKGTLVADLIRQNLLRGDIDGHKVFIDKPKTNTYELYENMPPNVNVSSIFVRIAVHVAGDPNGKIWELPEFWRTYAEFYETKTAKTRKTDLCYVQGINMVPAEKHRGQITSRASKSKIISSNDTENFTFRGRFSDAEEAFCIGYETSQKALNTLSWLIDRQSWRRSDQAYVIWGTKGEKIPNVLSDTSELTNDPEDDLAMPQSTDGPSDMSDDPEDDYVWTPVPDTSQGFAQRLISAMNGYRKDLNDSAQVVMMGVNSATDGQGRLAVTYYQEVTGSDFLERVQHWHETCVWFHRYKRKKTDKTRPDGRPVYKMVPFLGAPAPIDIIEAAYQTSREVPVADALVKATMDRLVPCILEKRPIPRDIVQTLFYRACNPMVNYNYDKIRTVACAMICKWFNDESERKKSTNKEKVSMSVSLDYPDRSFQFGRLLACAQNLESYVNWLERENRTTNAERMMHQFSKKPMRTFWLLKEKLQPYEMKLQKQRPKVKLQLETEMNAITAKLGDWIESGEINKPLTELFIIGYSCQMEEIRKKIVDIKEQKSQKNTLSDEENETNDQ